MTEPICKPRLDAVLDYLLTRRSLPTAKMTGPGPDDAELELILRAATRVPDHGKLAPWRIHVVRGEAQHTLGKEWAAIFERDHPDASDELIESEAGRPARAPLLLIVSTRIENVQRIPRFEQLLSGAGVCLNAIHAANALGFFTTWITDWPSYHPDVKAGLGIPESDEIIGLIYVGSALQPTDERPRPALEDIVSYL
ncbi:MAG: nitroreductase [Chloroflexi bacterium]|nr:nitroreductase [Chloroflexota bacterium]